MKKIYLYILFTLCSFSMLAQEQADLSLMHIYHYHSKALENSFKALSNSGMEKWEAGNYEGAMIEYRKMLHLAEITKHKKATATAFQNIGFIYTEYNNYNNSIHYYKKALWLRQLIVDTIGIAKSQNNLAQQYAMIDSFAIALRYYNNALCISKKHNRNVLTGNILNNLGNLFLQKERQLCMASEVSAKRFSSLKAINTPHSLYTLL